MNEELLLELESIDIPLLTNSQLQFLEIVNSVIETEIQSNANSMSFYGTHETDKILYEVSAIEENLRSIINHLRGGRAAKKIFVETYPKWKKIREDGIEKMKEIADTLNKHRFNCNVAKLTGYCTSFVGGTFTLASAALIPFTMAATTPLAIAGGTVTAAGCSTAIGTSVTEAILLKKNVNQAKEIIQEDEKYYREMNDWLNHTKELERALVEILSYSIVKEIAEDIKKFVGAIIKFNDVNRTRERIIKGIRLIFMNLPPHLQAAVPLNAVGALIALLVALFLILQNSGNRLVFDCASLTVRSVLGIVSLLDDVMDVTRLTSLFAPNAVIAKDLAKAVTRGAVAVVGIALDVAGIALTSIDIHKGSLSPQAEAIQKAAEGMSDELKVIEEVYNYIK